MATLRSGVWDWKLLSLCARARMGQPRLKADRPLVFPSRSECGFFAGAFSDRSDSVAQSGATATAISPDGWDGPKAGPVISPCPPHRRVKWFHYGEDSPGRWTTECRTTRRVGWLASGPRRGCLATGERRREGLWKPSANSRSVCSRHCRRKRPIRLNELELRVELQRLATELSDLKVWVTGSSRPKSPGG